MERNITASPVLRIIFNTDLKMSEGKKIAQAGHAIAESVVSNNPELALWRSSGQTIVILGASEYNMLALKAELTKDLLKWTAITDDGRTEVAPKSLTCIAIGPTVSAQAREMTASLRLL